MTQKRRDNHSTEFGLWLRNQPEIDSKLGYVATNIDYVWKNYKTDQWMIIEEKRYGHQPRFYQQKIFDVLNWCCKHHPKFYGVHVLVFENTRPDDGNIFWDGEAITKDDLLKILKFEVQQELVCEIK
jgi:hypothetical protein